LITDKKEKIERYSNLPIRNIYGLFLPLSVEPKDNPLLYSLWKIKKQLTLDDLKKQSEKLVPIPETFFEDLGELKLLKNNGLFFIEDVIFHHLTVSKPKTKVDLIVKKLANYLLQSAYILPLLINSIENFKLAVNEEIETIYDLLHACKAKVFRPEFESELHSYLSLEKLEQIRGVEQQRLAKYLDSVTEFEKVKEKGIESIGELVATTLIPREEPFSQTFQNILSYLRFPVAALPLSKTLIKALNKKGYIQVCDLLLPSNFNEVFSENFKEKDATKLGELIPTLTFSNIRKQYLSVAYPLQKLSFIKSDVLTTLQRSGFSTVMHLLLPTRVLSQQSSVKEKELNKICELLDTPVYLLIELIRHSLKTIFTLQEKKIHTLRDLLLSDINVIAKDIGISSRQLMNWLTALSKQSLIIAKKELVPIKSTLPFIDNAEVEYLKKQGYTHLQQLVVLSYAEKKKKKLSNERIQSLLALLEEPIEKLNLTDKDIETCKSLDIKTIGDFILYPASLLEGKLSINYAQIKKLKSSLKLKKVLPVKKPPTVKKATKTEKSKTSTKKVTSRAIPKETTGTKKVAKKTTTTRGTKKSTTKKSSTNKKIASTKKSATRKSGSKSKTSGSSKSSRSSSKSSSASKKKQTGKKGGNK